MKVTEHIEKAKNPLFSYEIVPPPRGRTVKDVVDIVKELVPYSPPWIDVTSHSSGAFYHEKPDGTIERRIYKKRPGTIGICGIIQNRFKIDTVAHILCNGFTQEETEDALIELNYLGVENVLALRGDGVNYNKKISNGRRINNYASNLVTQVDNLNKGQYVNEEVTGADALNFCIGVAGYPEKHFEAPNLKQDIRFLKQKVELGAEYIATQMFFETSHYINFVKHCRSVGIECPIIPGLKILKSVRQLQMLPKNFYINFPEELVEEVMANPEHVKEIGFNWACRQVEELLNFGVPTVHFYIMNDVSTVTKVVKRFM